LRGAWQNLGYFRVKVSAEARSLGSDSNEERFLVTAHVDEGLQYIIWATFDFPMFDSALEQAFQRVNCETPFHYTREICSILI
jgi:hypothetical protein